MQRILYLLFAITMITACDKGGDDSQITGYDRKQLTQTLYADQTEGDFTFTASESWTTQITDVTRATATDMWITLDPSHGDAGTLNMTITLAPNLTGKDRTATIRIVCGDTTITITVEQKATTEAGGTPDEPQWMVKRISRINSFTDGVADGYVTFEYDAQGHHTKQFCIYDQDGTLDYKAVMTYTDRKIKIESYSKDGEISDTDISEYTLDASGRAVFIEETLDGKLYKADYAYDTNGYLTDYYAGAWWRTNVEPDPVVLAGKAEMRLIMNHAVWENGNMKTMYDDWQNGTYRNKTEYEYTTHKNGFATIDLMMGAMSSELLILNIGTYGKIRKNLIAKETVTGKEPYNTGVYNWSYKFDNTGFYVTEFARAFTAAAQNPNKDNYTESYKIIYE